MKKIFITFPFLLLFLLINLNVDAQSTNVPLGRDEYQWIDHISIQTQRFPEQFNTFNKAYDRKLLSQYVFETDSNDFEFSKVYDKNIQYLFNDNFEYAGEKAQAEGSYPILNSIYKYKTDFYTFRDENFLVKVNPVIFYQGGKSLGDTTGYKFYNTRGLEVKGNVMDRLGFYAYVSDNQMKAPDYVQEYIAVNHAVPHEGYYKFPFKKTGVDFLDARGYFTFSALKYIHFTFGQDRIFYGDGIRSLFMSDASSAFPFLRVNFHYKKFDYDNVFMQLTKQWFGGDQLTPNKFAAMHHLTYNVADNFQIGAFESVIFHRNYGYELTYLNPLIFYRYAEQYRGSPDNAGIGLDGKWNIFHKFQLYGQLYIDEFNSSQFKANHYAWTNKYAIQAGLKWIDLFGIKNMDAQAELNVIRPFVYSHGDSLGNYTNYNQAMAHPMGANLKEAIFKLYYQPTHKLTFTATASMVNKGLDTLGPSFYGPFNSFGGNPMTSYLNRPNKSNELFAFHNGDGANTNYVIADFVMSWQISHQVFIDFNFTYRTVDSQLATYNRNEKYFGIGFRMNTSRPKYLF